MNLQEKKRLKNKRLAIIFISVMLFLIFLFFLNQILAFADPESFNYRIDRLRPGEGLGDYLRTSENVISLVFMGILFAYLIGFLLKIIFSKNSMHLEMILLGQLIFVSYTLTRIIYCFHQGSTSVIVAFFYLISLLGGLYMFYGFIRRGLDGDALLPYYVAAIICFVAFFFASATKSSYSLLNAYSHMETIGSFETNDLETIADVVYWGGYASTRLFALTFVLLAFINLNFEYHPELVLGESSAD